MEKESRHGEIAADACVSASSVKQTSSVDPRPSAAESGAPGVRPLASRRRRLASLGYESFLIVAVLFVAGFILVPITQAAPAEVRRSLLQALLMGVAGLYCVLCWQKGQTLAMKAWFIAVRRADGSPLDFRTAALRFVFALAGTCLAGIGFWWSLVDRDRQFLHDRLAGTRLFDVSPSAALEARDHHQPDRQKQ